MNILVRILFKYLACLSMLFIFISNETISAQIIINEVMSSNQGAISDGDGEFSDWIELYNSGDSEVDMSGVYLSDDEKKLNKWTFPYLVIPPKEYLLVWASGKDKVESNGAIHTNFSISANGEPIILTDYFGIIQDSVHLPPMSSDQSYSRIPDGSIHWAISSRSTPGKRNELIEQLSPPTFSQLGGIYSSEFVLTLSSAEPEAIIIYTLDGSDPNIENLTSKTYEYKNSYRETILHQSGKMLNGDFQSKVYTNSIQIDDNSNEDNRVSNISTTFHFNPRYFPKVPIKKATVVKARVFKEGYEPSAIVTHSYIFRNPSESPISVISLSSNDTNFFDYYRGLLVAGTDFEKWRVDHPLLGANNLSDANYHRRGEEYEYPIYFEMFDNSTKSKVFEQDLGFRIHGNFTRTQAQKSLRLYARKEYGKSTMDYDFFSEKAPYDYKRIVLRSYYSYRFGDTFFPAMVNHLKIDTQRDRPCIVYLNGEYSGVYEMKERTDKHYLKRKYNLDEDNIDFLENDQVIEEGDNEHYQNMMTYIKTNSLTNDIHYQKVTEMMDVENYIDYQTVQIFSSNSDWPENNVKYWRLKTDYQPDAEYGHDGRWRWILMDMDFAFGMNTGILCSKNMLSNASEGDDWSSLLLFNLLKNEGFKTSFINRAADLLNTTFQSNRLLEIVNQKSSVIEPYILEHIERWNDGGYDNYQDKLNRVKTFVQCRTDQMFRHYISHFKLKNNYTIQLDINDHATDNKIKINTILLDASTVGISNHPYPWQGKYFTEVPVIVSAIPDSAYVFSHWEGMPLGTPSTFTHTFKENTSLVAHFLEDKNYELKYTSGVGGSIQGVALQNVRTLQKGQAVTAVANDGYEFVEWSDGSRDNPRIDSNIVQNIDVEAVFREIEIFYDLKYTSGIGGLLLGDTLQNIKSGENGQAVTAVANDGYEFLEWSDGSTENPRTDSNIVQNIDIEAIFREIEIFYDLKYTSGIGGFIQGDTLQNIKSGENGQAVTAVANDGYEFLEWSDGSRDNPRVDTNIQNYIEVSALFSIITNLKDISTLNKMVYPNPTKGLMNIEIENHEIHFYRLMNNSGSLIISGPLSQGKNVLDISTLPSGLYLLELISHQGAEVMKIIKF